MTDIAMTLSMAEEAKAFLAGDNRVCFNGRSRKNVSQIRYSLVVILELNGGSEVQYKDMIMVDNGKYQ